MIYAQQIENGEMKAGARMLPKSALDFQDFLKTVRGEQLTATRHPVTELDKQRSPRFMVLVTNKKGEN